MDFRACTPHLKVRGKRDIVVFFFRYHEGFLAKPVAVRFIFDPTAVFVERVLNICRMHISQYKASVKVYANLRELIYFYFMFVLLLAL